MKEAHWFADVSGVRPIQLIAVLFAIAASGCSGTYSYSKNWTSDQGKTIAPTGSSYSYKVPTGFFLEDRSDFSNPYRQYETGVNFVTGSAVVRVSEQTLTPPHAHVAEVQRAFIAQASHWPNPGTNWRHLIVAGAPALEFHLVGLSRDRKHQEAQEYAVFKGPHLVYVSCNWMSSSAKSHALDGCRNVLKSLRIKGVADPLSS